MTSHLSVSINKEEKDFNLDVSFEVGNGLTTLFGPSGSGKTMVLDCIAGLRRPDTGRITFADALLFDSESKTHLRPEQRNIGYVFQNGRLFPHLSVEQNLLYGFARRRHSDPKIHISDITGILGIESLLPRRTHELSGGEQQRIAIGRAVLSNPALLLMDEPLASLDTPRRLEILPFIERLKDAFEIPIIFVSHDLDEVIRLSDLTILIEAGRVRARGPVDDILNKSEHHKFLGISDPSGDTASPSTILNAQISEHDLPFNLTRVHGEGLSLWIPRMPRPIGEKIRIRLRASDVAISRTEPENTSILNTFKASVDEISEPTMGFVQVALRLDSGLKVWSRITFRSATRLELQTGNQVWGSIKSVAVVTGAANMSERSQ